MKNGVIFLLGVALILEIGCTTNTLDQAESPSETPKNQPQTATRFLELSGSETGVKFGNWIKEDFKMNYYSYGSMYNGGGVSIGDINNDGLPDLYFVGTMTVNKLYLNKGDFKFEDISEKAGVQAEIGFKTGVAMIDINNDGFLDIFVCRSGLNPMADRSNLLYINNGDLTFSEQAKNYGLDDQSNTSHVNFIDYDLDGDLDIYLLNHQLDYDRNNRPRVKLAGNKYVRLTEPEFTYESDRLYRNEGNGRFKDVSKEAGIHNRAFGLSTVVSDFNNDNYPDIFVANDFIEPDFLYINNRNGTFTDQYEKYFRHISQNSMGADIADFNNDGLEDLVVLDMLAEDNKRQKLLMTTMVYDRYKTLLDLGYGHQIMRNILQMNNGNGTFSEIGQMAGISNTDWSWGPLLADFDNDGWKDLFIANGFRRDIGDLDFIKFKNDSINAGGGMKISEMKSVYDVLNKIPSTKVRNYLYRNKGDLSFQDVSDSWGFSRKTFSNGTSYGDLDNDGDLDLVVSNIDEEAILYRNQSEKTDPKNYIQINFAGPPGNVLGLETKVELKIAGSTQLQVLKIVKGYLSSVQPMLHFGLGSSDLIDMLKITWTDGKTQVLENVPANQSITIKYEDAQQVNAQKSDSGPGIFADVSGKYGIQFKHKENDFVDFKRERLIPHQVSTIGPCIEVGDVNGDGLDDFFVGGAAGTPGALFVQNQNSTFTQVSDKTWASDKKHEDVAAAFFDKDGDGDLDLYIVSGDNSFDDGSIEYQDRLYENDGKGNFTRKTEAIPSMYYSGGAVAAGDYDGDGDMDLFVGGYVVPGRYPTSPRSFILENKGGNFTDVTARIAPELQSPGMVSTATWTYINDDKKLDLVITGEWMPISIYINSNGILKNETQRYGLENTTGWWNRIIAADLDKDGDMDLVAGNLGLNSRFKASVHQPVEIFAKDFDHNGSLDPIMTCYMQGTSWPVPQKDALIEQIPSLKKKFTRYEKYANSTLHNIFTPNELSNALHLKSQTFQTTIFENVNAGQFIAKPLPSAAQTAPTNAILAGDFNADGMTDLIIAGNHYQSDVESGRYDAGFGLLLAGDGKNIFTPVSIERSGIYVSKESRNIAQVNLQDGKILIIIANNNDDLSILEWSSPNAGS